MFDRFRPPGQGYFISQNGRVELSGLEVEDLRALSEAHVVRACYHIADSNPQLAICEIDQSRRIYRLIHFGASMCDDRGLSRDELILSSVALRTMMARHLARSGKYDWAMREADAALKVYSSAGCAGVLDEDSLQAATLFEYLGSEDTGEYLEGLRSEIGLARSNHRDRPHAVVPEYRPHPRSLSGLLRQTRANGDVHRKNELSECMRFMAADMMITAEPYVAFAGSQILSSCVPVDTEYTALDDRLDVATEKGKPLMTMTFNDGMPVYEAMDMGVYTRLLGYLHSDRHVDFMVRFAPKVTGPEESGS